MITLRLVPVLLVCALSASAGYPADAVVSRTRMEPAFAEAVGALGQGYAHFVEDIVTLTEIPAPPFQEDARAAAFLRMLTEAGLRDVERDAEGNVMGIRKGAGGPIVAVSAHLDTVFPPGTDVTVRRRGTRLAAPGVADNSQSLAMLLAVIRAMDAAGIQTSSDILFVGTVGEEGQGSLRGVRHLFTKGRYRNAIASFVSIDGAGRGNVIVTGAVGSERHRVTFSGPGGHSYGSFGLVNPAHALGGAIQRLSALDVPGAPKTTYNVGRVGGGTSVNSIPSEAWMEVDLRSEAPEALSALASRFQAAMQQAASEENRVRSTAQGPIAVTVEVLATRPGGQMPATSRLVETAAAVTRAMGHTPSFTVSSTDANLPISLGIPAITIDSGIFGGRAHSPDEWIDVDRQASFSGLERALLMVVSVAEMR
jgi:acetylornithine deacetylase/succinyl-diaminopimelate desuccinylase-like protein